MSCLMIYIYDDGVHNNSYVMTAIKSVLTADFPVAFCTASMILDGCLAGARLLIMPGGADLYFCEKLNGEGNQRIRAFIEDGGAYFGICAGAYYACTHLDWNNGEIAGARELGLVEAVATGPVRAWIEDGDINKSWMQNRSVIYGNKTVPVLYNGGCLFKNLGPDVDILARYSGLAADNAAIIETRIKKGKAVLSSPHVEKFGKSLLDSLYKIHNDAASFNREKRIISTLSEAEDAQKALLKSLVDRLLS